MRPVGPRPAGFAFGKAVGVAACTGRPTLGGLLVELLEDPPVGASFSQERMITSP